MQACATANSVYGALVLLCNFRNESTYALNASVSIHKQDGQTIENLLADNITTDDSFG